ncbi:MAG TPA: hypothetical protein VFQ60_01425 [Patescibacteria group bacterium]|nr:hypothetical protein [Patescibacteria group bacterium]
MPDDGGLRHLSIEALTLSDVMGSEVKDKDHDYGTCPCCNGKKSRASGKHGDCIPCRKHGPVEVCPFAARRAEAESAHLLAS